MGQHSQAKASSGTAADLAGDAYALHGHELYRFARRWTGSDADAQDVVQDVVVRAWRAAERFDPARGSLRTWLFAIARNVAADHGRTALRRREVSTGVLALPLPSDTGAVDDVIRADLVARALAMLSADQRSAIVETYLRDRPYADVAAEMGISQSTIRSRVYHGLRALRDTVDRMEVTR